MRCLDADAMISWLVDVVGFTEHFIVREEPGGVVAHAQLAFGSSLLMLGQGRDDDYGNQVGDLKGRRTDSLYVAVKDVDALHDRIKASGAKIEKAVHDTDYGSREFHCRDPEGNLWSFGTYWPKVDEPPKPSL